MTGHREGDPCEDLEDCRLADRQVAVLLDRESEGLHQQRFAGVFSPETVRATVQDAYDQLNADARIHTHLPVLAARSARDRLEAGTPPQEETMTTTPEVLFVCVHNAGRSQMAAALLTHYAQSKVRVRSAGSAPTDQVNPAVAEAMAEIGIDISAEVPKKLTTDAVEASDVVITMGCGDACPVVPGKRYLDWKLDDPAGQGIDAVRPIRDDLDRRVQTLLAELVPADSLETGSART